MIDNLLRDLGYAIRALVRTPAFTLAVLLTLAFGLGANTAVFSVVNSVLLKPLAYPEAEQLVSVWHTAPGAPGVLAAAGGLRMSPSMYFTYAEQNRTFQSIGLWRPATASVTGLAQPEEVHTLVVGDGVLPTLGIQPALGRWFSAEEYKPGGALSVILSHEYWQRRFGGDPAAIGRVLTVNAQPAEIVGVMPAGYHIADTRGDLLVTAQYDRSGRAGPPFCCQGIARLKPEVTLAQANADLARMLPLWVDEPGDRTVYLDEWKITPALQPLKQAVIGDTGNVLWVVMGTIGIVLLIACANVTNLLLVRADGRQRELAVRAALGAGSGRIARTLLIESPLLGLIGGALGLAIAYVVLQLLIAMAPAGLPRLNEISLDARALGVTLIVSLLAGLLLGLIPALRFSSPRIRAALYSGGRSASQGREQHRTQNILVVAQVALALVLLVSSGLMIRTFQALHAVAPGFTDGSQLQTLRLAIPPTLAPEAERVVRTQNEIVDAIVALPGVSSAAFGSSMPLEVIYSNWHYIDVEGRPRPSDAAMHTLKYVSPGFFSTAGTRLIAGRDFTWTDIYDVRRVALVSENLARQLWSEPTAAVGQRIRSGEPNAEWSEVIGVVEDVRENGLSKPAPTIAYWPTMMPAYFMPNAPLMANRDVTVIIRSPLAGTATLLRQIEQAVWSVHPDLPIASPRTMADIYDRSLVHTTFTLAMLAIAGGVALTLGVIGLYGVLSYIVAQRRRDIAIRLALGARQRDIARSFVQYGVTLAIAGVALGLGAAAAVTRLMASLLHGVQPLDAITYATVAVLLTVVAALASYLPARRASSVDPAEALAAE